MNIQVCASCYVVDFDKEELLMIYNKIILPYINSQAAAIRIAAA